MSTFSFNEAGKFISLKEAVDLTTSFRKNRDVVIAPSYSGQNILPVCETVKRELFEKLLAKPGCAGIRMYSGMSEDLKLHAVFVAVNADGDDILPGTEKEEADDIIEDSLRCPPYCPSPSPLNGD